MEQLEAGLAGELKSSAWFDPTSNNIYQGKVGDMDRVLFNTRNVKQAAIPSFTDISSVNIAIILQEILGLGRPLYNLRNITRTINMNALKATIPIYTFGIAQEKVPPLAEASVNADAWSSVTFALWKNVQHIVVSDELQKIANVDIFGVATRDAAGALAASENKQIAAAIDTGEVEVAALGLWNTITGGRSVNSPYTDIVNNMATIQTAGYRPRALVMAPKGWGTFFGNDFVKGQLAGAVYPDFTQGGGFPVPGLPGVMGFSDFALLPATSCYVLDTQNALILGSGPFEGARYRNEQAGYDAYIMRQWLQPLIGTTAALIEITNVTT